MPDVYVADNHVAKPRKKVRSGLGRPPKEYSSLIAKERKSKNPLSAFSVQPRRVRFETQEKQEKILLLLRRHPITNVGWLLILIFGLVVPLLAARLPIWIYIPIRFQIIGAVIWYLLVLGYLIESFLTWYFNVYIVTDERIIDIDFYSLIYKEFSAAKTEQIQDVTFTQGGVARAMFNFGTIFIQTAVEGVTPG